MIDKVQFDTLYRQNYARVRNFVVRHGFCEATAEDIVQESFVNAWEKRSSLASIDTFGPWVRAISRNLCFLHLRSKRIVPISEIQAHKELCELEEIGDAEEFVNWFQEQNDQSWNLEEREHAIQTIAQTIEEMPESIRKKIGKLFYLDQCSVQKITAILGLKQNTVLSHLRRFRQELTKSLLTYDPSSQKVPDLRTKISLQQVHS